MVTNTHLIETGKIHELKIWPKYMEDLICDRKTFEIRSTKDREFHIGDTLLLNEFLPDQKVYTGRQLRVLVTGVHIGLGVAPDFAVLSLANMERTGNQWIDTTIQERVNEIRDEITAMGPDPDVVPSDPIWDKKFDYRHPRLPGSEGLAEKVQEIKKGPIIKITPPVFPDLHDVDVVNKMRGVDRVQELVSSMILDEAKLNDAATTQVLRRHGYVVMKIGDNRILNEGEEKIGLWKTFDSAPKDGSIFLAFHATWKVPVAIQWDPDVSQTCKYWITGTKDQTWPSAAFSGWMPMPEAFKPLLKNLP